MGKARRITKILLYILGSCFMALVITFLLHRPSMKVLAQWKQPADITYDGWGPYYLSIVESDRDWRGFPLHVERNYFIYAGRDAGTPSHGHMIKYSFHANSDDIQQFLGKALARWATEGVTLELRSGHRLFIPKAMFIGGR
jgi:hypothetical protein